jgi:hypothetical protein
MRALSQEEWTFFELNSGQKYGTFLPLSLKN